MDRPIIFSGADEHQSNAGSSDGEGVTEAGHMAAALAKITRRRAFSAARQMAAVKYRRLPNWSFAMELYALGSTYAWGICVEMGIDPDATTATPWDDPARPGASISTGGQP